MKELPYFKFYSTEWMTGNIVFEPLEVQGLFINICALYWKNGGVLRISEIEQRYKKKTLIAKLTDRFFSVNDGFISISFLNEQLSERQEVSKINSKNGSKGGRPSNEEKKANANRNETETKANESNKELELEEEIESEKEKEVNKNITARAVVTRENIFSDCFTNWFLSENETPFKMQVKDFVAIASIERYCTENKKEGFEPIAMFQFVLSKFSTLPDFYQNNKNPTFINSKFPEIIALLRQKTIKADNLKGKQEKNNDVFANILNEINNTENGTQNGHQRSLGK